MDNGRNAILVYEVLGNIGAFSFARREGKIILVVLSLVPGLVEESSQLGANDVTAGQNLRSFIACARAGAAVIPACTHYMDGKNGKWANAWD
ncbi:hypothetical protein V1477_005540 [Vespula maculifrons]|uniref:Uncharacterized protein n=1 Tax=Vespula maculifrons TaxID=7453 RepID=A0ABD2CPX4_VESMC